MLIYDQHINRFLRHSYFTSCNSYHQYVHKNVRNFLLLNLNLLNPIHWDIYDGSEETCILYFRNSRTTVNSPGALDQNHANLEKCKRLKFPGKILGCPLNTLVQSSQKSQRRKIIYLGWPPSPPVYYCYTLKSCTFFNICHRKKVLVWIPMFWKTGNTV